jgi:hypothetical protein
MRKREGHDAAMIKAVDGIDGIDKEVDGRCPAYVSAAKNNY